MIEPTRTGQGAGVALGHAPSGRNDGGDQRVDQDVTRLSVLDLVPVRTDQTTADAIAASVSLARTADELGFTRYWVAEHHNMPAVAATNPPVLIAILAAATGRIRLGSGGVMLPNHAPLVIAEQFALLEAAYPDRIDLGVGRARFGPGDQPHAAGGPQGPGRHLRRRLSALSLMMQPEGVQLSLGGRSYPLAATPRPRPRRGCGCSARRCTQPISPPRWGCRTCSRTTSAASRPSPPWSATAASSSRRPRPGAHDHRRGQRRGGGHSGGADRLTLAQRRTMWRLRSGQSLAAQELVEEAEAVRCPRPPSRPPTTSPAAGSSARLSRSPPESPRWPRSSARTR